MTGCRRRRSPPQASLNLSQGASLESICAAIQDLNNFLTVFPDHMQAQSMRQFCSLP